MQKILLDKMQEEKKQQEAALAETRTETLDKTPDETVDKTLDETPDETLDETPNETLDETLDETPYRWCSPVSTFQSADLSLHQMMN